jgi:hypothetical protein
MNHSQLTKFYSLCPIVRRETLKLTHPATVPGMGPVTIPCDKEIVWVRESESQIVLRHKGHDVKEDSTYSDFYGFTTSFEGAVGAARKLARELEVDSHSTLSVEIVFSVYDVPALQLKNTDNFIKQPEFANLTSSRWELDGQWLKNRPVIEAQTIWTTTTDDEESASTVVREAKATAETLAAALAQSAGTA